MDGLHNIIIKVYNKLSDLLSYTNDYTYLKTITAIVNEMQANLTLNNELMCVHQPSFNRLTYFLISLSSRSHQQNLMQIMIPYLLCISLCVDKDNSRYDCIYVTILKLKPILVYPNLF